MARPRLQETLVLAAILLLAALLRLYRLDQLPPGLHYDEAFKAVEARKVIAGSDRPIFFQENLTEEPMMIYAAAASFVLFGDSPWALRLVSAAAGILTVAALYLLARALFQSARLAALSAFVLAVLYWHVNFSRLGMEPILTPLAMTLSFAFLWRGLRSLRKLDFMLAGLFLGATLYTYKAALFVPVLAAVFIGVELAVDRTIWTRYRRELALFVLLAVLVFLPLGLYFAAHPGQLVERPSTVVIASSGPAVLAENAAKVAGMLFVRGDDNPRSNLPGRPALDPFLALGFIAGVGVCLGLLRHRESRFLVLWLIVMALPSVLTDYAPHFGRSIGLTPVVALTSAQGLGWLFGRVRAPRVALALVLAAGLASSAYSTVHDYFGIWGAGTGLFDSFDTGLLQLAQKLRDRPANEAIYLSPTDQEHYTVQYGLDGRDARSFDGRRVLVLPPPGATAGYGIISRQDPRSLTRLEQIFPRGRIVDTIADPMGRPYAVIFRAEDAPQVAPRSVVHARLDDAIDLIGDDSAVTGRSIALTLYWGSVADTQNDYTVFVHLIAGPGTAVNPTTGSPVWAQQDSRPGGGSYPTWRWQAGEVVIDDYALTLPPEAPSGEYLVEVGMYILKTGVRARVTDLNGARMENDRVLLKGISLP